MDSGSEHVPAADRAWVERQSRSGGAHEKYLMAKAATASAITDLTVINNGGFERIKFKEAMEAIPRKRTPVMVSNLELSQGLLKDKIVLPTAVREISWCEIISQKCSQFVEPAVEKFTCWSRQPSTTCWRRGRPMAMPINEPPSHRSTRDSSSSSSLFSINNFSIKARVKI